MSPLDLMKPARREGVLPSKATLVTCSITEFKKGLHKVLKEKGKG